MPSKIFSCTFQGLDCKIIEVEADISSGLPAFNIVGLADTAVQESKERVRASIKNAGASFPLQRKTINLAPAQIRKQGSLLDLPIAVSILLASCQIDPQIFNKALVLGELSLNAKLKRVPGILAIAQHAKSQRFKRLILPQENAAEASYIKGLEVIAISDLRDIIELSKTPKLLSKYKHKYSKRNTKAQKQPHSITFNHLTGLEREKRALSIVAAGGHNILFSGPPGIGKTALCRSLQSILPPMSQQDILETSKLYSVANLLDQESLIHKRPFREIHHSATKIALIGGGAKIRPGEISLAHNGVLFLDEITEFPRQHLENLRQPLQERFINLSRANYNCKLPTNFTLVATMNPCPCGKLGKNNNCQCSLSQIKNYQAKLSGPIRDRIDIFIKLEKIKTENLLKKHNLQDYETAKKKVEEAYKVQKRRYQYYPHISRNSDLSSVTVRKFCCLEKANQDLLLSACEKLELSNRTQLRILKISRTIADLDGSTQIKKSHLAEAIQYRDV